MSDLATRRRVALVSGVLALVVGVTSSAAFFAAFRWDIEAGIFGDPKSILDGGSSAAALLHWGAIGDMFYSYLLLLPIALYLHALLRPRNPWLADLGTAGALAYIFVGGAAAAILATVGPSLIDSYAAAAPSDRLAFATSFDVLRNLVFFGVWQTLDPITAGTWLLSVGWLIRPDRRALGPFLVGLGVVLMVLSVQTMLGVHSVTLLAVEVGLLLVVWTVWLFVDRGSQGSRNTLLV